MEVSRQRIVSHRNRTPALPTSVGRHGTARWNNLAQPPVGGTPPKPERRGGYEHDDKESDTAHKESHVTRVPRLRSLSGQKSPPGDRNPKAAGRCGLVVPKNGH